jgi:hypothetical protein
MEVMMSSDLFRFMMLRPPQEANEEDVVSIIAPSDLQVQLRQARAGESPRTAMLQVAQAYTATENYVQDVTALPFHKPLMESYAKISAADNLNSDSLRKILIEAFKADITQEPELRAEFNAEKVRVADSIIAILLSPQQHSPHLNALSLVARLFALIDRVDAKDKTLDVKGAVKAALTRTLVLPKDIFPLPSPLERLPPGESTEPPVDEIEQERVALVAKIERMEKAVAGLSVMDRLDFVVPQIDEPAPPVLRGKASAKAAALEPVPDDIGGINSEPVAFERPSAFVLTLKPQAVERLEAGAQAILTELKLDPVTMPVPLMINRLESELTRTVQRLDTITTPLMAGEVTRIGSNYFDTDTIDKGYLGVMPYVPAYTPTLPTSHGTLQPIGIGDLLVVKQQIKRYEAGEVGHIENVLKSESKKREHRRSRRTEEFTLVETELTTEEERDLQSTERFELKRETDKTLKEDSSLKIGVSLSASYGPTIEFKSNVDFALNTSKQESTKQASTYSKDVTSRSASKVIERVREERSLRTIEEFEEINQHGLDNTNGADHVIGIYQWVDKIYEAQVFNYGKRMLFDIMVPEPAAFLIEAMKRAKSSETEKLVKPLPFTLRPDQISSSNYGIYVQRYNVAGVEPPPKPYVTVSKAFDERSQNKESSSMTKAAEVPIPSGYQAVAGSAVSTFSTWESTAAVDVVVGDNAHRFENNGSWHWYFTLDNEVETVPMTVKTFRTSVYALAIELNCQRTQRTYEDWQNKTHGAIVQAFLKLQSDYEEKLAALAVEQGIAISGRNPLLNRQLEKSELKKACISLFTYQHYDLFNSIEFSPQGYPQTNLPEAEAEGRYIRFFEQAFEWEQIMYLFYPYFWGRKYNWLQRALIDDTDPLFAEFLKAGAARIVLPVRPGFEKAVAHFLQTGDIWSGGDLPDITSPLYLSIIEEIKERQNAPGAEIAEGDPWEVRLPTTLVKLRTDTNLPQWQKDAQGTWLPV